ncbi:MAG: hypothetical protein HY858_14670 [Candidatus Solibacter usitatus]|nr:hypothetical protein [Candidatus Solibacter usitatus]
MFTGVAINASSVRRQYTHALAVDSGMLILQRATDQYPTEQELTRLTSLAAPDVLLLDMDNPELAVRCLQVIQTRYTDTPVIAFGGTPVQHKALRVYGIQHFLPYPTEPDIFVAMLAETIRANYSENLPNLFAFLPAKAGCGASTITLGLASALANHLGKNVLCMDTDLRSGAQALMLDLDPRGSTQGALKGAYELDNFKWTNAVTRHHEVDFLLSTGNVLNPPAEWSHYFALIRFVEKRYDAILADLPELINGATEEVVRRANLVFLVTTQEPVALRLAARRFEDLKRWGVPEAHVRLVVNRWQRRDTSAEQIEAAVGLPVSSTLSNDYNRVRATLQSGISPVPADNAFGKELVRFGQGLMGVMEAAVHPAAPPEQTRNGFAGVLRLLVTRQAR